MEKLSSILPSNARVKSVDLEDAHPIRPGTPVLGRPVSSTSSQRDRMTISPKAKEAAFSETLAKRNPREDNSVKIVKSVTDGFFNNRIGPKAESDFAPTLTEQVANHQIEQFKPSEIEKEIPTYTAEGTGAGQVLYSGQLVDKNA